MTGSLHQWEWLRVRTVICKLVPLPHVLCRNMAFQRAEDMCGDNPREVNGGTSPGLKSADVPSACVEHI